MPRLATLGVLSKVAPLTAGLPFESVVQADWILADLSGGGSNMKNLIVSLALGLTTAEIEVRSAAP